MGKPNEQFAPIPVSVLSMPMGNLAKLVYGVLLMCEGPYGCCPGIQTIADYVGRSETQVKGAVKELEAQGLISKRRGPGARNYYRLDQNRREPDHSNRREPDHSNSRIPAGTRREPVQRTGGNPSNEQAETRRSNRTVTRTGIGASAPAGGTPGAKRIEEATRLAHISTFYRRPLSDRTKLAEGCEEHGGNLKNRIDVITGGEQWVHDPHFVGLADDVVTIEAWAASRNGAQKARAAV